MSAASGITASKDLLDTWASATADPDIRFIKVAIEKESLVPAGTWSKEKSTLDGEFARLDGITEQNTPAYLLVRMENGSDWLFIAFVPDTAKVRDKMLYASSRNALTKALGGERFKDTIFATSKSELTPEGYAAHKRHLAAPKPLSPREMELEAIRAAEKDAAEAYESTRSKKSIVGTGKEMKWAKEVEDAVSAISADGSYNFVVISIDLADESLTLHSTKKVEVDTVISSLPTGEPSYSLFYPTPSTLIFIYACPSDSKVKTRMIYSTAVTGATHRIQQMLSPTTFKRLETSDPKDLDLAYMREIIRNGSSTSVSASASSSVSTSRAASGDNIDRGGVDNSPGFTPSNHPFARPKGPGRRR
ncbi:Twinfilin-1 [Tulasnella sp. 419]|nr:Twinfilin-1 [Tulasnella sp. 419]